MFKRYSIDLEKEDSSQYLVGFLCGVVYAGALFFPLMDKDAAHHANIALHMVEHNDYVSLVDRQTDYLDKPHFLFWISALSFKILGVNTLAYRLPAVLFALLSVFSTYKLALHLSNKTTAKMAALMLATAQGFILSINDARMETPLGAAIIFGLWNMIVYIDKKKWIHLAGASLGAAIAFSTKGWIGPVIIFIAVFFYIFLNKKWAILAMPKTWLFLPLLAIFISPVVYAYYLQYDLHPEKVIRNMTHISGVKFILWDQSFERFGGENFSSGGRNSSVWFLYHTFLWAFFPWCIVAYMAVFYWLKRMFYDNKWNHPFHFAVLAFAFILFTISFSKFKMPHYIFMLMPLAALFTAPWLRLTLSYKNGLRFLYPLHIVLAVLVIVAASILNYYFFQPQTFFVHIAGPLLLVVLLVLLIRKWHPKALKLLYVTAMFVLVFNFFMNYNFFPNLMRYQGGNELAKKMRADNIKVPDSAIVLLDVNAHSFDFYRNRNHDIVDIAVFSQMYPAMKDKYFLLTSDDARRLEADGFVVKPVVSHLDYNVARMKLKFLNPTTRVANLDTLMLAKIYK